MRAEVVLVGDELLADADGVQPPYMGELLRELGADLRRRGLTLGRLTVAGDGAGELAPILADAAARGVDLVLTVGGLGPTHDDRVRDEVATVLGQGPPEPHPEAMAWLVTAYEGRGIAIPQRGGTWERMAYCPLGARPLRNPAGLACGLALSLGRGTEVRCLPGVTYEALPMWRQVVLPDLEDRWESPPPEGEASLLVRGAREGLVGPVVEAFLEGWPGLRAGVYLVELVDGRFSGIRVTLRGDPSDVEAAVPELAQALRGIEGAWVEDGGGGGDPRG